MNEKLQDIVVVEKRGLIDIVHFLTPRLTDPVVSDQIKMYLLEVVAQGKDQLVIDFSAVDYLSSSYLSILVAVDKTAKIQGGGINICGLKPSIQKVFSIARFDTLFDIFETEKDAVEKMISNIR